MLQISESVYTPLSLLRAADGKALALNNAQKLWLIRHGLLPYNKNDVKEERERGWGKETVHPRAHLGRVKDYPVNKKNCTAQQLEPYCAYLRRHWQVFLQLR